MRRKKNAPARLEACAELRLNTKEEIDELRSKGRMPLRLEIGCGKGDFAVAMSARFPDEEFIAVEMISDVALLAMEKAKAAGRGNLHFLIADAANLCSYFQKGDVKELYLNFSDPWPKRDTRKDA